VSNVFNLAGTLAKNVASEDDKTIAQSIHDKLKAKINELQDYYSANFTHHISLIDEYFEKWKAEPSEDSAILYEYVALTILKEFENEQTTAYFKSFTPQDVTTAISGAAKRNLSLIDEINKAIQTGKKIYVMADSAHLYNTFEHVSCEKVKETLHSHNFVILTSKKTFNWSRAVDNKDRVQQKTI